PGSHDIVAATQYFIKAAEANLAEGGLQKLWVVVSVAGSLGVLLLDLNLWPLLLVWVPLPFYMLSIAYGGVPVFVPTWWPFSFYNVRYGIQLLPAIAVFSALTVYFAATLWRPISGKIVVAMFATLFVVASYASVWHSQPVCFREATVNSRTRIALESALANNLRMLPK